ncbi:hypothetical protein V2W45_1338566 [Cenococcum geophilum]
METLNISDLPPTATSPTVPAPMTYEPPEEKVLNNSNDLLALLDKYEGCVDNISWLFCVGKMDLWTDKIISFYTVNTSTREYSPSPIIERVDTPILRLSAALRPHKEEGKLKYVVAIQCRSTPVSYKLVVSNSKKAAGMDMFYEVLNGNSISFVGAVLKDVPIPVEHPHKFPQTKFKRVESVEEAEEVGEGVVGIIC